MTAGPINADPGADGKVRTICRACQANCSLIVEMDAGKPVKLYGDKDNPVSHGFSCIKGRNLAAYHGLPSRLLTSMQRRGGAHHPVSSDTAMTEIGQRLNALIAEHGPRSVALYCGTFGFLNILSLQFANAFMEAIGSPMFFTSATIDQPGKLIAPALMGTWLAGWQRNAEEIDAAILIGQNPVVSLTGSFGFNPAHNIVAAKRRGMELFVVDPRKTETVHHADIFIQPRPGQDAAILAGMIHVILGEDLHDHAFVAAEASGVEALRQAVAPFTPARVAACADISEDDLLAMTRRYAAARKGLIVCGTGTNMSGHGTLAEYLSRCVAVLCGHYPRAGDKVDNPGVLFHPFPPPIAAATGAMPQRGGTGQTLRVHGLTDTLAGMPTAALADEILTPGEGQVRALIVLGGNPMLAWPDQIKVAQALDKLDLLICIDPKLSATARVADYVLAPTLPLEQPGVTSYNEFVGTFRMIWGYDQPYAQYTPALTAPPAGSDLLDDWQYLFGIARAMGRQLSVMPATYTNPQQAAEHAVSLDMIGMPTSESMLDLMFADAPVPLAQVRDRARGGHVFDVAPATILPKPDGWEGRFDLASADIITDLAAYAATLSVGSAPTENGGMLLISRRLRDSYNSSWHEHEPLNRQHRGNPAMMNPFDLDRLGLVEGDVVEISSDSGTIWGIAKAEAAVRVGCVSMSHCWGVAPGEQEWPHRYGGATSRLPSTDENCERYSWMALQSAIPVRVTRTTLFDGAAASAA